MHRNALPDGAATGWRLRVDESAENDSDKISDWIDILRVKGDRLPFTENQWFAIVLIVVGIKPFVVGIDFLLLR